MKPFNCKLPFFFLILVFYSISPISTKESINLSANFSCNSHNNLYSFNNYTIKTNITLSFNLLNKLTCKSELETDNYNIRMGELSFDLKVHDYLYLMLGKFENLLTIDLYLQSEKRFFASNSLTSILIDKQGYISNSIGLKAYKPFAEDTVPISYFLHFLYLPSHIEAQLSAGFFFHYKGADTYLGLIGCYFPFIAHDKWLGKNSRTKLHNYLLDLVFANHNRKIIYGTEITFGSNIIDPIGIIEYSKKIERSFFLGGDLYLGYSFSPNKINIIPVLRYSILFPEIQIMEYNIQEIRIGNCLSFSEIIYFNIDTGIRIHTKYISNKLYTQFRIIWALNITVKY